MRIISGKYKGRRFSPPSNFKARPTTDFAKENLFNVLGNHIDWEDVNSALDLFGGTGGISFEMVSRGCKKVTCIEMNPAHAAFIEKTKSVLQVSSELLVLKVDVFKYLKSCRLQYDFIFADPPYDLKNFADIPRIILENGMLNEGAVFVLEHPKEYNFESLPMFWDRRVYGSVNFSLFRGVTDL